MELYLPVDLPEHLTRPLASGRRGLRWHGNPYGSQVAHAMAEELGLRGDYSPDTEEWLVELALSLDDVIREGPAPVIEHRGDRIIRAQLEDLEVQELYDLAVEICGRRTPIPNHELRELSQILRDRLAGDLAGRMNKMLARWQESGHLSPDIVRRTRREVLGDERTKRLAG